MLLQSIRDRASGWIAWVIVILISIPFALFGIQQYLDPVSDVTVATVDGTDVSIDEFQRAYQRQRARLRSVLGESFDFSQLDEDRLRERTLERLVNDEVVLQAALAGGMRVGDRQLARAIQSQELFQQVGTFSDDLYQQWLRTEGYSPGGFETDLKRSMLAEQFVAGIAASAIVTDRELANAVRLQGQKRVFDTLTIPAARFSDVQIDDAAVRAEYQANQVAYIAPEQVKLEYIEVSRDAIAAGIDVGDEELRAAYERRKADFQTPEQREASHIMLALEDGADEATVAAARERLLEFKKQIEGGASFEELAREYSEDPGSSEQGGSLGRIGRGTLDPAFEDAAFKLAVGEISDPVRSAFGLHLIRVDAINASKLPSFDEVRDQMRTEFRNNKAEQEFVEQLDIMTTMAFESPESLDAVANALGLAPGVTDWISPVAASNSGIGSNPAVIEAAFNPDVLLDGFNSEPIELDPSRVIVLRVAEQRPSRQMSLEEVRDRIERQLVARESRKLAAERGRELLQRLRDGQDQQSVAAQAELDWSVETELARTSPDADTSVVSMAFRMLRPVPGQTAFDGTVTSDGDFVIVALKRVIDGALADDQEQRIATRRNLEAQAGRAVYDAMVQALRSNAKVVLMQENL
ncbi:MAG: SurA N-terminal domain-containing protein [Gammaproteobacteria bacterium]|nr:MAG: SurA N-terminal domain-containing protein [Gammaproteobacteria bacterium]